MVISSEELKEDLGVKNEEKVYFHFIIYIHVFEYTKIILIL